MKTSGGLNCLLNKRNQVCYCNDNLKTPMNFDDISVWCRTKINFIASEILKMNHIFLCRLNEVFCWCCSVVWAKLLMKWPNFVEMLISVLLVTPQLQNLNCWNKWLTSGNIWLLTLTQKNQGIIVRYPHPMISLVLHLTETSYGSNTP